MACNLEQKKKDSISKIEKLLVGNSKSVVIDYARQKAYFYYGPKYLVKNRNQAFRHAEQKMKRVQGWLNEEFGESFSKGWIEIGEDNRDSIAVAYKFPHYVATAYEAKDIKDTKEQEEFLAEYEKHKAEEIARGVTEEGQGEFFQQDTGNRTKPDEQLSALLKDILNKAGITVSNETVEKMGKDTVGLADLAKKLILIQQEKENEDTLPEEVGHFAIEAMIGTPLYERAMNNVTQSALYQQEAEKYRKLYNGNEEKVKKEILGKLFGYAIKNRFKENQEGTPNTLLSLLKRLWANFLLKFRLLKTEDIDKAIETSFSKEADRVLKGELKVVDSDEMFAQLKEEDFKNSSLLQGFKEELKEIIKIRTAILGKFRAKGGSEFTHKEQERIEELTALYNNKQVTIGLVKFINQLSTEAEAISDRFESLMKSIDKKDIREIARTLRYMNNYVSAYRPIINALKSDVSRQKGQIEKADALLEELQTISTHIDNMESRYEKVGTSIFADALEEFAKQNPNYNRAAFEKSLLLADKNISFTRRFLDSMAESSDDVLQVIDRLVKEHKETARLKTDKEQRLLIALDQALKKDGIKDTEWMFERDSEGDLTGNLVQKYNYGMLNHARTMFYSSLLSKYNLPADKQERDSFLEKHPDIAKKYHQEWAKWFQENTKPKDEQEIVKILDEKRKHFYDVFVTEKHDENIKARQEKRAEEAFNEWKTENILEQYDFFSGELEFVFRRELSTPSDKYLSKEYESIQSTPSKKAYYDFYMNLKKELSKKLPESMVNDFLAIQIRKDWIERVKSNGVKDLGTSIKEEFTRTEDEVMFGNPYEIKDENGHLVDLLPIYFTKKLANMKDLSLDATATLGAFIAMANNYGEINKIVDILELGKDILAKRKISTGKKSVLGKANELFTGDVITEEVTGGNAFARYKDYLDMVIYGKMKADEGSWDIFGVHLDRAKVIDAFNQYTAINGLALNIYAAIANPILGNSLIRQEQVAGEYVKEGALKYADKTYWTELNGLIGDIGKPMSTNKLRLFIEKADLMQDFEQRTFELNLDRSRFGRLANMSALFFLNHVGEHQMQVRMGLAIAHDIKLVNKDGKKINLYEAMSVNKEKGDIEFEKGLKKEDGTPFTEKDFIAYSLKVKAVNQRLHGIYNQVDRSALQKRALGRMALMFRKFVKPGFNRRYEKKKFNYALNMEIEGSYRSFARFMKQLYVENKLLEFHYVREFDKLTPMEKANIKRTLTEMAYLFGALTLAGILMNLSGDDDDNWLLNMTAYQANRMYSEIGFYAPPFAAKEFFRIMESPAAGVDQMETLVNYYKTFDPFGALFQGDPLIREIKSGKNKGQTYFWVNTKRAVPLVRTIEKGLSPEEQLQFFVK